MRLELTPWAEEDLGLLRRINVPEMKGHLGGPESEEKIVDRHRRYVHMPITGTGVMFRVALLPERTPVGSIGYWDREWHGDTVWETGWSVLNEFQGRGIASEAAREVIARAAADGRRRWLQAFPKVNNAASNAVCRKAGFTLVGETDFEFPIGTPIRCNEWKLDLSRVAA
ncbi:GNAT family N-acetyltransferase [Catenuloplanes atrovinosus]|uniref:RimJ/RimL family protein N-acetyltransferase n=1 Tax=Catenuloplanes atrovinosus TaxID=137266 RepID=A0AAE4C7X0_9ACTN|nr:GNAT family N-acetyltransferase [Catenuloplanes atrovinosus]MDR7274348.1 RimJ/RimL family protein N-acetyltransferase [Catenuloplanes atrovinosus]